jgi:hypothetical protein
MRDKINALSEIRSELQEDTWLDKLECKILNLNEIILLAPQNMSISEKNQE